MTDARTQNIGEEKRQCRSLKRLLVQRFLCCTYVVSLWLAAPVALMGQEVEDSEVEVRREELLRHPSWIPDKVDRPLDSPDASLRAFWDQYDVGPREDIIRTRDRHFASLKLRLHWNAEAHDTTFPYYVMYRAVADPRDSSGWCNKDWFGGPTDPKFRLDSAYFIPSKDLYVVRHCEGEVELRFYEGNTLVDRRLFRYDKPGTESAVTLHAYCTISPPFLPVASADMIGSSHGRIRLITAYSGSASDPVNSTLRSISSLWENELRYNTGAFSLVDSSQLRCTSYTGMSLTDIDDRENGSQDINPAYDRLMRIYVAPSTLYYEGHHPVRNPSGQQATLLGFATGDDPVYRQIRQQDERCNQSLFAPNRIGDGSCILQSVFVPFPDQLHTRLHPSVGARWAALGTGAGASSDIWDWTICDDDPDFDEKCRWLLRHWLLEQCFRFGIDWREQSDKQLSFDLNMRLFKPLVVDSGGQWRAWFPDRSWEDIKVLLRVIGSAQYVPGSKTLLNIQLNENGEFSLGLDLDDDDLKALEDDPLEVRFFYVPGRFARSSGGPGPRSEWPSVVIRVRMLPKTDAALVPQYTPDQALSLSTQDDHLHYYTTWFKRGTDDPNVVDDRSRDWMSQIQQPQLSVEESPERFSFDRWELASGVYAEIRCDRSMGESGTNPEIEMLVHYSRAVRQRHGARALVAGFGIALALPYVLVAVVFVLFLVHVPFKIIRRLVRSKHQPKDGEEETGDTGSSSPANAASKSDDSSSVVQLFVDRWATMKKQLVKSFELGITTWFMVGILPVLFFALERILPSKYPTTSGLLTLLAGLFALTLFYLLFLGTNTRAPARGSRGLLFGLVGGLAFLLVGSLSLSFAWSDNEWLWQAGTWLTMGVYSVAGMTLALANVFLIVFDHTARGRDAQPNKEQQSHLIDQMEAL